MIESILVALRGEGHVVDGVRCITGNLQAFVFSGFDRCCRDGVGNDGGIDVALRNCQQCIVLSLVSPETAAAPILNILLQGDRFVGSAGIAQRAAFQIIETVDVLVIARQYHHLECKVRDGHGHNFCSF
ncbi:hypothetical protein D3C81_1770680 [compost metagenome]